MILCRNHSFSLKMQNSSHGLCRNHLFSPKMQNFFPELCRNHLFPLKMQNFSHGLCRNHLFSPKMQNPPSTLCRIQPSPPILIQKRISLVSPSACGGSLLRQNSLPTHGDPRGAFFCHRTHFPMTQKRPTSSVSLPSIPLIFPIICSAAFSVLPPMRKAGA